MPLVEYAVLSKLNAPHKIINRKQDLFFECVLELNTYIVPFLLFHIFISRTLSCHRSLWIFGGQLSTFFQYSAIFKFEEPEQCG
jgi:hypothetical protein